MVSKHVIPIIGQEAVCPDGLGRVVSFNYEMPYEYIEVQTYYNNRQCAWAPDKVRLIRLEYQDNG